MFVWFNFLACAFASNGIAFGNNFFKFSYDHVRCEFFKARVGIELTSTLKTWMTWLS